MSIESYSSGIAQAHMDRYFPNRNVANIVIANARMGQFMIWTGNGNNGKTTFSKIIENACFNGTTAHTYWIPLPEDLDQWRETHIRCVIIEEADDYEPIDSSAIEACLDNNICVIMISQRVPKLMDPKESLLARTTVIPFVSKFSDTEINPDLYVFQKDPYLPHAILRQHVNRRAEELKDFPPHMPLAILNEMNGLRQKAVFTATPAPANTCAFNVPMDATSDSTKMAIAAEKDKTEKNANDKMMEEEEMKCCAANGDLTHLPITLRFKTDDEEDDVMTIEVDPDSDGFFVTFEQNSMNSYITSSIADVKSLKKYLEVFLTSISWDSAGYDDVQFDVPMFATVLLPVKSTKGNGYMGATHYARMNLFRQIEILCEDWPISCDE
jgi:hypothetical protein